MSLPRGFWSGIFDALVRGGLILVLGEERGKKAYRRVMVTLIILAILTVLGLLGAVVYVLVFQK